MTGRERDIRRAMRRAQRLGASMDPEEYRAGWALEARLRKATQRRMSWEGGAFEQFAGRYRANYLEQMGAARRAGRRLDWKEAHAGAQIWRSVTVPL